ncbi:TPA: peptide deformylase [Patescibacteria group bacterium]|uniref:Peptide deformylase n=1 Tax=Candidatus Gottesmanbacteria bacterium GW2011_GWA1_43_11 TaxID=1618436 RepID=A0A0G1FC72_9BACT|nr:MAG: Peptide deformylase [Candidatus Gottesmanbacteria bacterium GW2011_GWA1_43_11]HCS78735.1 peptide deformylase [Patescibacteria group bacterium]
MSTLLQVAQLGQPILRQKAQRVENIKATNIQQMIDDLLATVMDVNGVGIAAPQVYQSYRIFIVASHPNPRYPQAPDMEPTPMINPKLVSHNKVIKKDWEGCLSIPGIRGLIPRFTEIKVEYTDRNGKKQTASYTDFVARIFQHENDHLNGVLFLDRLETTKDLISDKEYQKMMSKKK